MRMLYSTEPQWIVLALFSDGQIVRQDRNETERAGALAGFCFEIGKTMQFNGETDKWGRALEIVAYSIITYDSQADEMIEGAIGVLLSEGQE